MLLSREPLFFPKSDASTIVLDYILSHQYAQYLQKCLSLSFLDSYCPMIVLLKTLMPSLFFIDSLIPQTRVQLSSICRGQKN